MNVDLVNLCLQGARHNWLMNRVQPIKRRESIFVEKAFPILEQRYFDLFNIRIKSYMANSIVSKLKQTYLIHLFDL